MHSRNNSPGEFKAVYGEPQSFLKKPGFEAESCTRNEKILSLIILTLKNISGWDATFMHKAPGVHHISNQKEHAT